MIVCKFEFANLLRKLSVVVVLCGILPLSGCATTVSYAKKPYSGQLIQSREEAEGYEGITLHELTRGLYTFHFVGLGGVGYEQAFQQFALIAQDKCEFGYVMDVGSVTVIGQAGADLPDEQWLGETVTAELRCKSNPSMFGEVQ